MFYLSNVIPHIRSMHQSAARIGAQIKIDMATLRVEVSRGSKYVELLPTFAKYEGRQPWIESVTDWRQGEIQFCGWSMGNSLAFELPIRTNRLAFKAFCGVHGVNTPAYDQSLNAPAVNVLIKEISESTKRRGAIKGPVRLSDAKRERVDLGGEATYIEEFIDGDPFQAWYFSDRIVCLEVRKKPFIEGDGFSSVEDLIGRIVSRYLICDDDSIKSCLRLNGIQFESVLRNKERVSVGVKFYSGLEADQPLNENVLGKAFRPELLDQFKKAGIAVMGEVPSEYRAHAILRLTGVIDVSGKAWFTSINSTKNVHPDVYSTMLPTLFGVPLG